VRGAQTSALSKPPNQELPETRTTTALLGRFLSLLPSRNKEPLPLRLRARARARKGSAAIMGRRPRRPLVRAAAAALLPLLVLALAATRAANAAANAALPSSPSSPELTATTFAPYLRALDRRQRVVFLGFASWCGHCVAFMPLWNQAARWIDLKIGGGGGSGGGSGRSAGSGGGGASGPRAKPLLTVKLDCAAHGDICDAFAVRSYPTILAGTAGQILDAYEQAQKEQEGGKAGEAEEGGNKKDAADKSPTNPALAALRRFPGGGPKGDGAAASLAYRHDAKGTVAWVGQAAFFSDAEGEGGGSEGESGGESGSSSADSMPPLPAADSPVWSFDEDALAAAEAEAGEGAEGDGGSGSGSGSGGGSEGATASVAAATATEAEGGEGWSLADAEAATLELWDQALSAMAAKAKEDKGNTDAADADDDPWLAARAVLALWQRAHPSPRCREGSRSALEALWTQSGGRNHKPFAAAGTSLSSRLRAASSPALQVCGPAAEAAWARAGRGARGGGEAPWERCRGSVSGARGYTCGLWVVWHACAARLAAAEEAVVEDVSSSSEAAAAAAAAAAPPPHLLLSEALRRFAAALFRCRECAAHFSRMLREGVPAEGLPPLQEAVESASSGGGSSSTKAAALWLWRAHDAANRRLARDEARRRGEGGWTASGDPSRPKRAWPSARQCPDCVVRGGGGGGGQEAGAGEATMARWLNHRHEEEEGSSLSSSSSYWDLDAVASFLQRYYGGAGEGEGLGGGGGDGGDGGFGGDGGDGDDNGNGTGIGRGMWLAPPFALLALALGTRRGRARMRMWAGGGGAGGLGARPCARRGGAAAAAWAWANNGHGGGAGSGNGHGLLLANGGTGSRNGGGAW
jgi:thiol oxidase